jgi:hypothetical protein
MRITVRIRDELLKRAKKRASDEGGTLASLIEEGLELILAEREAAPSKRVHLPVSKATGGVLTGVDLNRSCDLEELTNKQPRY